MPNNYWDDLFQSEDTTQSRGGSVFDDIFSDDFGSQGTSGGLQMDEWTPEYQKSKGWNSLFDNPVVHGVENTGAQAASSIFGVGSSALDLFDTVTNSKLAYTGPIGAFVDLPKDKDEELNTLIDKNKQTSLSGAASDIFGDVSNMFGEAAANVSTKKDFNGGMIDELKGDIASGSQWEATKDVAGFGVDMLAGLGGMAAAGGPLAGEGKVAQLGIAAAKEAGSAIGAGMALDVYGDTYADLTKNENDSRLLAVTVAAANAGVQGVLEKIGWEVAVGKTAFGQWFKDSATASAKRMIGARILLAMPTEGLEEGSQQLSDIAARRLPEAQSKGWDTVFQEIASDAVEQLPEAMFSGALGGLLLGGGGATLEALMGRKGAADIAARHGDLPNSPEDKIAIAIDAPVSGDKAHDTLLDVVEEEGALDPAPLVIDPVVEVAKKERVKKLSKKAQAAKDAADQAIKDLALEQEKQRAELGADKTTADIDAAAERITKSIDAVVQEKQTQVGALMGVVGSMTQLLQGTQPTFNTGAEGEQETVQAPQIQASPEEVSGVILAKAQELGLEVPIEAIQNPIGFDWSTWGQQQVAQAKESVVEGLKGPVDAIRSSISVEPDSPMASVLASIPEPTVDLPEPIYEDESVSSRQLRFERMRNKAKAYEPDIQLMESSLPYGTPRGAKVFPGLLTKSAVIPVYEALNRFTKNFKYDKDNRNITEASRDLGTWLKGEVAGALPGSRFTETEQATVMANTDLAVQSELAALKVMPAMKRVIFNVWQTAPRELVERLGNALTYGNDANTHELAQKVADHLATTGLFSDVAATIRTNPQAMEKFSASLIHAGKGVMSPWSMERIMLETGVDYRAAKAGVAAMETMAERWAMKNGKDIFEWWDRIGDYAKVGEFKQGTTPYGSATAYGPEEMRGVRAGQYYSSIGKGLVTLFKHKKSPGVRVALHESIHMLHSSGLMNEMLDQDAKKAMEDFCGEALWGNNGDPLNISAVAGERMAVGFEKFIYENDAPNPRVRAAFDDVKQWFANYIKKWLNSLGVVEHLAGPSLYAELSVYGQEGDPVHLKLGELDIDGPMVRSYYQLLNANLDGTEIVYSSPGIATAVENLITATTGIEAKGVLTYQPESTLPPYESISPKDDWSIHEPNGPSDSQWRRMIGLTNDESNGTHTHATLLEMAKNRERVADLAKRTSAQKGMVPPAPLESRASVNREVLSAVGEGILEGEPLLEEMSKHLHDVVMNGGMDGHNSGVATDPTKVEQVKDMLTNFVSKMRSWAYLTAKGDIGRVGKELSRGALYALVKPMQVGAKAMEKAIGNYGADWSNLIRGLAKPTEAEIQRLRAAGGEEAVKQRMAEYESMDMLSLAEFLNNNHALSKLADKVAELRPQLYDIVKHVAVPIPGARSFNEITTTFNRMAEAYFAANKHKLPFRDEHEFHEAVTRDLRLWMFSARQFELVDRVKEDMAKYEADVAAWEKSTAAKKKKKPKKGEVLQELEQPEKPKKPRLPKITEEGTRWAESVKMLMEMRYGKNLAMFKATAQELTQWENHMVLDKLLNVGMITAKEHADMYSKGKHHIPMYRLRSMLDKSGAINTRLDDSMYKVLDYLKHDISMKMEDPINAMLRKAAGIEMLTMRQHAKNALGKRILADVRWWDIDYKDSPLSILSQKIAITKEEYNELSRTGEFKLTSAVKYRKDDQGNRIESGHTYYKHVPFTAEDVESGLKYATNPSVLKVLKKTESQARSEYEHKMFAFYPEPGKPMYVHISDPALQKAFFYMNNQQAVWANSVAGKVFSWIDSFSGAQEQAELQDKFAYHAARLAATGYFGMNKISKSFITAAPAFIYNTLFRDLPGAKIRSRTGLRWIDIPGGFVQSAALMFPSMMEVFPERFDVARDASQGMATFSGLSASNADGSLDANVLMSLTRGRGEKMAKAKAGHYGSMASLMWGDMKQFFAKEGLTTAPGQMWSELKRGKNVGKHFIAMGLSPFTLARAAGQFAGSIIENATRLTERGLMMSEDMSQYPNLVAHYDPKKAINGKILAGTTGTIHRAKWEMAKAKLKVDPNYKVPEDAMPVQSNLTERDNAMSHVTVHFPQKGYWTASMDQLSMFYNPMAQDFYTNMMILTRHSALQKATAYALGDNWEAAKDQVKLDSAAYAWIMKSLFYVTLPMLMMMTAYGGDDDDSQDWQAQSFIEKSSYFWIPTNKLGLTERPLRVASGLGLFSLMFKDLPMAGMLEMQGKDPKAYQKWARRFFDSTPFGAVGIPAMDYEQYGWKPALMSFNTKTVPWLAPESINPWLELGFDRQQFRDKAIAFPQELSREDPTEVQREKYNMLTNAITKAFSSARMQPAQVQYLISRYFTGSNRWLPVVANKAMEMAAGAEGVPQDVQSSNSPLANQSAGWAPRVQARESYGMGNEFVQSLLSMARDASEQRKSYDSMVETRKPGYLAEHPIIADDIYFGKRGTDGYRSGGLQAASKKVIEWERSKREALKAGRIDKVEALLLEKQYTLFAMEAGRNVVYQLAE